LNTGILLVNLGTPDHPTPRAVRRYLREFLGDPRVVPLPRVLWLPLLYSVVVPLRSRRVARAYRRIWMEDGSPLGVYTGRLAQALEEETGVPVTVGMRYGRPSLRQGVDDLLRRNVDRIVVLPLYPQYSKTTTATVFDRLSAVLARLAVIPSLVFHSEYHSEPAYIDALAASIEAYWQRQGRSQKLLMSFHGLPDKSREQGDPYYHQCVATARLMATRLGLAEQQWQLVFQSRFGPAKWLKPYCVEVLQQLPGLGVEEVDMVCPGFPADYLETLEEIAVTNREVFLQAGGKRYRYIPALNDSPIHVKMLRRMLLDPVDGNLGNHLG